MSAETRTSPKIARKPQARSLALARRHARRARAIGGRCRAGVALRGAVGATRRSGNGWSSSERGGCAKMSTFSLRCSFILDGHLSDSLNILGVCCTPVQVSGNSHIQPPAEPMPPARRGLMPRRRARARRCWVIVGDRKVLHCLGASPCPCLSHPHEAQKGIAPSTLAGGGSAQGCRSDVHGGMA